MTAYLLDTHTLLWALTEPARLGALAREVIVDRGNAIFVSAASAWEIATKQRIGRLPHAVALTAAYQHQLRRLGCGELPVTSEHALLVGSLDWDHRDPFDRMIVAQALCEGLPVITRDAAMSAFGAVRTLWD